MRNKAAKLLPMALILLLGTLPTVGQNPRTKQPSQPKQTGTNQGNQSDAGLGQQVFTQNCSRCHKAPEGIPPSISGTVALHMRVRASLSEKDYKRLLAFLGQ